MASEGVQPRNWTAPPGNGYGFIYDLKRATGPELVPGKPVLARWDLRDAYNTRVDLELYSSRPLQVYQALGPDMTGTRRFGFLIGRSQTAETPGEETRYLAVVQAYQEGKPAVTASWLVPVAGGRESVAVGLELNAEMAGGKARD